MATQFQGGSRGETITSIKGLSNSELSTPTHCPFSEGGIPPLPPAAHGRLKYRIRDASRPLNNEASVTETGHQGDALGAWLVEIQRTFIRRTQGRCRATKEVTNDVLSRGVEEAL